MNDMIKVLYLDDEENNLIAFKALFRREFDVFTITSPQEAVAYLNANEVPIILSDQKMPELSGVEFWDPLNSTKGAQVSSRCGTPGGAGTASIVGSHELFPGCGSPVGPTALGFVQPSRSPSAIRTSGPSHDCTGVVGVTE